VTNVLRCVLAALYAALLLPAAHADAPPILPAEGELQAAFAPGDDIYALLEEIVAGARERIRVQAYLLTSKKLSAALIAAHRRGVDVQVLLDSRQSELVDSSLAPRLARAGIPVWLETRYQNAHNKVLIVDPDTPHAIVVTGSFNFTWTAQHRNAENVLIVRNNRPLAARYAENWERHRRDATRYAR